MRICILNHTPAQELGDVVIPQGIELWGAIPRDRTAMWMHLAPLRNAVDTLINSVDPEELIEVIIAGEPRACHYFVTWLESMYGVTCYAPYSERVSVDELQPDGSVIKRSVFRFAGLGEY